MEQQRVSGPTVELSDNRRAVIDGCDGIMEYEKDQVVFRAGKLTLCFTGRGLKLVKLTDTAAVIEGVIQQVEYLYGEVPSHSLKRERGEQP